MDEPPSKALLLLAISFDNGLIVSVCTIAIAILLAISAFVSASERAFFTLKATDLYRFANSASVKEKTISDLIKDPRKLFATLIALAVLINVSIIAVTIFLVQEIINPDSSNTVVTSSITLISTLMISIFAVIMPRRYAAQINLEFTKSTVAFWNVVVNAFSPISTLIVSSWKRMEVRSQNLVHQNVVDGLNQVFELAAESEEATEDEREILKGIANFGSLTARQIMRSRVDISAVDVEMNFHELMDYVNKFGFSRMPVFRNTIDKIEGVLYIKDLLPFIDHDESFYWQKLIRPGFFIPENKKIDVLLRDFQKKHIHIAMVVDEYGGTLGLITLEDIIEEIIGDINDEFDDEAGLFRKIDENTFVFEGKTSLHDFCKNLEIETELFEKVKGESESLGGLILELNNELPAVGKKISFEQFTFVIEAVDKKRVKRIRVHVHEHKES